MVFSLSIGVIQVAGLMLPAPTFSPPCHLPFDDITIRAFASWSPAVMSSSSVFTVSLGADLEGSKSRSPSHHVAAWDRRSGDSV